MFTFIAVLPFAILVLLISALVLYAKRSENPVIRYSLICSCVITAVFLILDHYARRGPTAAALRPIFLPFDTAAIALASFIISWAIVYIIRFIIEQKGIVLKKITTKPMLYCAIITLCIVGIIGQNRLHRNYILKKAEFAQSVESEKILAGAISSHDLEVLSKLAKNPNTPTSNLIRIYDSCKFSVTDSNPPEYRVFDPLSYNPKTPAEILIALSRSKQSTVRSGVARNPATSQEVLRRLSTDDDDNVRIQVAINPDTPTETLYALSTDRHNLVRAYVSNNPKIPKEFLFRLAEDTDQTVRDFAKATIFNKGYK